MGTTAPAARPSFSAAEQVFEARAGQYRASGPEQFARGLFAECAALALERDGARRAVRLSSWPALPSGGSAGRAARAGPARGPRCGPRYPLRFAGGDKNREWAAQLSRPFPPMRSYFSDVPDGKDFPGPAISVCVFPFRVTSAARTIRLELMPWAMADMVWMEHGATTMASVGYDPLASRQPISSIGIAIVGQCFHVRRQSCRFPGTGLLARTGLK